MNKLLFKIRSTIELRRIINKVQYGWLEEDDLYLQEPVAVFFTK